MVIVDTGATLDWSGGDISIGSGGTVVNRGTLAISTTGNFAGTVGATGFTDYSSLGSVATSAVTDLADAASAPDFTGSGPPYSWQAVVNIFNADGTVNTSVSRWWGDADVTAIPLSIGSNGVLVTPQDMIIANHYEPDIGNEVDFYGADGTLYRRYFEALTEVGGTDIMVATLNAPLPDTGAGAVTPMKLLPAGFTNYILNSSQDPAVAFTNQDRTLLIGQYTGITTGYDADGDLTLEDEAGVEKSSDSTLSQFSYPTGDNPLGLVRPGDSGSPVMMLVGGQFALMANWEFRPTNTTGKGPEDAAYITGINAAIAANAATLSGGPYAEATTYNVSTVDLSGFTDYSALL